MVALHSGRAPSSAMKEGKKQGNEKEREGGGADVRDPQDSEGEGRSACRRVLKAKHVQVRAKARGAG